MKIIHKSLLGIGLVISAGCYSKDIVIADFESDTFQEWIVDGEAFGTGPVEGSLPGQVKVIGHEGKKLANSNHNGRDSKGTLTSPEFVLEKDYINFLLGGGRRAAVFIELYVDGKPIYRNHPVTDSETLQWVTWDLKDYKGKTAQIKIVDNQNGEWGYILADHIFQSDTPKSDLLVNSKITLNPDKNYLLLPIQDDAPEVGLEFVAEGVKSKKLDARIAQTKIDYIIPVDISKYKGKDLHVFFDYLQKNNLGVSQIVQSDTYNFESDEKFRPAYHFTPPYGWMNDPNGLVYNNGVYHLFYQHNPYGSRWGNMHWGHAVSKDLITWEHKPVAIDPDSLGTIFSGSAVIDRYNTAGFGKDALVAIFTSAGGTQAQSIAYSTDNGKTFTKYEGNPVLSDVDIVDFRDPKVFWDEDSKKWIMSLATSQTITFYGSKNLKEWTKLSEFGKGIGDHGGVWECPDLFSLKTPDGKTKWVLLVSINPGGPNKGSATQYFIGNFDGKTFTPDPLPYPLWLDYGRDNYAGVTWANVPQSDGRRLFIGWMNNWDYGNTIPTMNFRSSMTVPRELKIKDNGKHLILANYPTDEVLNLRKAQYNNPRSFEVDKVYMIEELLENNNGAFEIEMTLQTAGAGKITFSLLNSKNEHIDYIFDLDNEKISVDRLKSGLTDFNKNFASVNVAPLAQKDTYLVRLLVDKASTELFVNNGEVVSTNTVFPTEPYNSLKIEASGKIRVENLNVYKLN